MAGAGGGGFMYMLARDVAQVPLIRQVVSNAAADTRFHEVVVDTVGLVVTHEA
jgi:hypothetical protein